MSEAPGTWTDKPLGFAALVFFATSTTVLAFLLLRERERNTVVDDGGTERAEERAPSEGRLGADELTSIGVFRAAAPSVVRIVGEGRFGAPAGLEPEAPSYGSGIVWDERGYIVTNLHVVDGRNRARVQLADGSVREAVLVGLSQTSDITVLAIDAPPDLLHPIALGTSADLLVGQNAWAVGHPFGGGVSLSRGVVSCLNCPIRLSMNTVLSNPIQTDAALNPGQSGGPLLDSSGLMIGLNTSLHGATPTSDGVGYAIPVDLVRAVVPEILRSGVMPFFRYGFVAMPDHSRNEGDARGVMLIDVVPQSPAALAGVAGVRLLADVLPVTWDEVISVNGAPVRDRAELSRRLDANAARESITLGLRRVRIEGAGEDGLVTLHELQEAILEAGLIGPVHQWLRGRQVFERVLPALESRRAAETLEVELIPRPLE